MAARSDERSQRRRTERQCGQRRLARLYRVRWRLAPSTARRSAAVLIADRSTSSSSAPASSPSVARLDARIRSCRASSMCQDAASPSRAGSANRFRPAATSHRCPVRPSRSRCAPRPSNRRTRIAATPRRGCRCRSASDLAGVGRAHRSSTTQCGKGAQTRLLRCVEGLLRQPGRRWSAARSVSGRVARVVPYASRASMDSADDALEVFVATSMPRPPSPLARCARLSRTATQSRAWFPFPVRRWARSAATPQAAAQPDLASGPVARACPATLASFAGSVCDSRDDPCLDNDPGDRDDAAHCSHRS